MSDILILNSPLDGWCDALGAAPDPVFATGMMGEGATVDPTSATVLAPCAGTVVGVPTTRHAVTLRSDCGVEVLVHVGIDTVRLQGQGFTALVGAGVRVTTGQPLLRLDLDALALAAKSLVTPIVVTDAQGRAIEVRHGAGPIRAGEPLLAVAAAAERVTAGAAPAATALEEVFVVPLAHGLHARPAALLAQSLKGLDAEVQLHAGSRSANARSVVAIMALGVTSGAEVRARASGTDAAAALLALKRGLEQAISHEEGHVVAAPAATAPAPPPPVTPGDAAPGELAGVAAVPGFAVGRAVRLERAQITVEELGQGSSHERAELDRARQLVAARLKRLAAVAGGARREIVAAHLEFLEDPVLDEAARRLIESGKSAGYAWRAAVAESVAALGQLNDARLRERVDDLRDIESHVLLALKGEARPMNVSLPPGSVLLAEDLLPSELVGIERHTLEAVCLEGGGATSHVAILAAAMDLPMLIGLGPRLAAVERGAALIVDADRARLVLAPDAAQVRAAQARAVQRAEARRATQAAAKADCVSRDGVRIEVFANLGSLADATSAVANGAEGCGLLRTEFLFLERTAAPDEAEQRASYQAITSALGGRPVILRLLDAGGDKPLPYVPLPAEENPALGLRGIRTGFARPELLRTQLRAALAVEPAAALRILIPMVTELDEIRRVRALARELASELGRTAPVALGAMIETPAAALGAARLAAEVEFLSIGSNDLSQYTLAMDRGHAGLAPRIDALHPAVLRLIREVGRGGAAARTPVAVCGGMAGDPLAVPVLLGFGVSELSVVPARIPPTKQLVAALSVAECRELAEGLIELDSAAEVRARVRAWLAGRAPQGVVP